MRIWMGLGTIAAVALASPVMAVVVPDGTVSSVGLFNPTVDLTTDPNSYSIANGTTFEISGRGGFAGVAGTTGKLNGTLLFSSTVGSTLAVSSLDDFFVFADGPPGPTVGTYNFTPTSVLTQALNNAPDSSSGTLFLLGTVLDQSKGYTATAASLTIQFNSTGGSDYSSALTLAVPPEVPEPASWAMMLAGFGAIGFVTRRQRRVSITYA